MSVEALILEFQGRNANQLRADLQSVGDAVDDTEDKFGGLKSALLGGLALGGLNALSNSLVENGNEAANVGKKLEAMLAVRGQSGALDELNDAFSDLSKQTGMDDDDFANAGAHLLSFGLSAKQVAAILPGIAGQADTLDQSLDSVADSFGRAFASGNAGALTKSGVVLSDMDTAAIKAASGISAAAGQQELFSRVLASYSQYAVAAGAGTTDAAKAQGNFATAIGNTTEAIGAGASEARGAWQAMLTPTIEALNENHEGLLKNVGGLIEYTTAIGNAAAPVAGLIQGAAQIGTFLRLNGLAAIANAGAQGTATAATEAHAAANVTAAAAQNAETAAERAKLPVLVSEAAGHEAAAAATLAHAEANAALGASSVAGGGAGVGGAGIGAGGAAGGLLGSTAVRAGGVAASGIAAGVVGYNATREDGMPSAGEIGGYYKNRLLGQNANESAISAMGGNPYALGDDAEKSAMELSAKMHAGGGKDARAQTEVERLNNPTGYRAGQDSGIVSNQTQMRNGARQVTVTWPESPGDRAARQSDYNRKTPRRF